MRAVLIAMLLTIATQAGAESHVWVSDEFRLNNTSSIAVQIFDDVVDGCFTNLREVREYAEEKLRSKGSNIVNKREYSVGDYSFDISVVGYRLGRSCHASVLIELTTISFISNILHSAEAASSMHLYSIPSNVNNKVLNEVKELIDKIR
jgi:hypothetical protein